MKKLWVLIVTIISIIVFSVLGEVGLRAYFRLRSLDINAFRPSFYFSDKIVSDRTRFISHPFLPFFPRPGDSRVINLYKPKIGKTVTYNYQNNSLGFRTPERDYNKQSDVKRVVTLGGSTTWDGPTNDLTWPAILERKLNQEYKSSSQRIEVINLGIDAANAPMSLAVLQLYGLQFQPDLVISYDGANDVWFNIYCRNILPDYANYLKPFNDKAWSLRLMLPNRAYQSYLATMTSYVIDQKFGSTGYLPDQIWRYTEAKSDKVLPTAMPIYFNIMRLMKSACREFGCTLVTSIPHWAEVDAGVEEFDSKVRDFFDRENFNYLDVQTVLPHNDYTIHVDSLHFTEKGLEMMAQLWLEKIKKDNLLGLEASISGQAL